MFGLNYLLAPLSEEAFITDYWGQRAVLIQGDDKKFTELFGWDEVNHFLNNSRTSYDGLRLLHEKRELPKNNLPDARNWLKKGATLVINSVNQVDPVVGRFSSLLGRELNTQVHTNCYASYTSKQGFDTHYDEHDVFIIQVEGNKQWAVFEPTYEHPLHVMGPDKRGEPPTTEAYIEYEMTPGDVLYIPRGHWHHAVAVTPSVHLTIGPQSRSSSEYVQWLIAQMMELDPFFRQDLPLAGTAMLGGAFSDQALIKHIEQLREKMLQLLEPDALRESIVQYATTSNPVRKEWNLPTDWNADNAVTPEMTFALHPEQKVLIRYDEEKEDAIVYARGQQVNLNGVPKAMLAMIFESSSSEFSAQAIVTACPTLELAKIRSVIVHLCTLGIVVPAQSQD